MRPFVWAMVVGWLMWPQLLVAQKSPFSEVTAPELKQMLEQEQVFIINNLSPLEFELQHIPGSINIPINRLQNSKLLPADKSAPLVFYCMNPK